jgi:hypothetical protein
MIVSGPIEHIVGIRSLDKMRTVMNSELHYDIPIRHLVRSSDFRLPTGNTVRVLCCSLCFARFAM